jgi:exonuclease VII small subunit
MRLLLLAVLLTGCAYREAMQRGQSATDQQDWPAAVAAYQAALAEDPEDPRAQEALAVARRQWHAQALASFGRAIDDGELGAAATALQAAEQAAPDDPATTQARSRLANARAAREAAALRIESEKASQSGDLRAAFRFAVQAERVHPGTPMGLEQLATTRTRLLQQARTEEAAGRWRAAEPLYETLASEESEGGAERLAFRTRWADHERALGEAAGADVGTALVHFAQAAALAGRPADATRRDALRRELLREVTPVVEVTYAGPAERAGRLQAALDARSASPGGPGAPRLTVRIEAQPTTCQQDKQTQAAEGQYVAGTRDVPNPEWQRARDEVWRLRDDLRRAEEDEARARRDLHEAERRMATVMRDHRERVRREREAAHQALERAREGERRAMEALRQAQDRRDESGTRRCEGDLDRARSEVERAWRGVDEVAAARRFSEETTLDQARDAFTRAEEERQRRRDRLHDAERRLDTLPPTHEVPRYATHRYAVHHWRRTCSGDIRVVAGLAHLPGVAERLTAEGVTRDSSHEVQVPLGLDEDPLRFSESDLVLEARLDTQLAKGVAKVAESLHKAWAGALAERAGEGMKWAVASVLLDRTGARPLAKARLAELGLVDFGVLWAEGP